MPAVLAPNQIGVREDLSDAIILADVKNTPLVSRMQKGEKLKNMLFSWQVDQYGNRRSGGVPDGKDVDAFEDDQRARLYGRGERFWRTPMVGTVAQKVNDVAGVADEYNRQITKKTVEQKRDIETEILSDQESQDDDGVIGSKFRGLGRWVNNTAGGINGAGGLAFTDTATAVPVTYQTPQKQIYDGALASFDEVAGAALLQARFDNVGATQEMSLFAGSALKNQISTTWGRYTPNKSGYTVNVRTTQNTIDQKKLIGMGIDVYEGDFGVFDITLDQFLPLDAQGRTGRGYLLDMEQLVMRPLMYCDHTELPNLGGGPRGLIDSILGYTAGSPLTHAKVIPQT